MNAKSYLATVVATLGLTTGALAQTDYLGNYNFSSSSSTSGGGSRYSGTLGNYNFSQSSSSDSSSGGYSGGKPTYSPPAVAPESALLPAPVSRPMAPVTTTATSAGHGDATLTTTAHGQSFSATVQAAGQIAPHPDLQSVGGAVTTGRETKMTVSAGTTLTPGTPTRSLGAGVETKVNDAAINVNSARVEDPGGTIQASQVGVDLPVSLVTAVNAELHHSDSPSGPETGGTFGVTTHFK